MAPTVPLVGPSQFSGRSPDTRNSARDHRTSWATPGAARTDPDEEAVRESVPEFLLSSRVAHVHEQICCSAREHGCHFDKEPYGRCGDERYAQNQQQIAVPGRLGRRGCGSSTIEVIDLVRID